ncbi:MAG: UDP-N-acetylmuramoyl-L-alanine--D-glutamate ligase [Succinivibrio sp.]
MNTQLNNKKIAVIGLGLSNMSVISYLLKHDLKQLTIFDTRLNPPRVGDLPVGIDLRLGKLDAKELEKFDMVVISPGISIYDEAIASVIDKGVEVVGDIELFAREAKAPVIGITGSNGKSTVTSLTGYMANVAKLKVAVGANIGVPVFDILADDVDLYVLELSSFELETTRSLKLEAACILNVSEDHLDRYHGSIEEYAQAKRRIFMNAKTVVANRDDPRTYPKKEDEGKYRIVSFGADNREYGIETDSNSTYLTVNGKRIIDIKDMRIYGSHNYLNALACMALADAVGISQSSQVDAMKHFSGLPHRCQLVKNIKGVCFYNDSKATNVASTQAALSGLKAIHKKGIILLAGGLGKGQDFTPLKEYLGKEVKAVFCFGKDKQKILALSKEYCFDVETMEEGLKKAHEMALSGQAVLLSPACASFDQFKGFEHRGQVFVDLVAKLEE